MSLSMNLISPNSFDGIEPWSDAKLGLSSRDAVEDLCSRYLDQVQIEAALEQECQRDVERFWLTATLMRTPGSQSSISPRRVGDPHWQGLLRSWTCAAPRVARGGRVADRRRQFKVVNTRDRNFTLAKMERRLAQIDQSIARYLAQLDSADRQGEAVPEAKITRLDEKIAALRQEIGRLNQRTRR